MYACTYIYVYICAYGFTHTSTHTHIDTVKACDTTNKGVERRAGTARIACVSLRQHTTNKGVGRQAGTARIARHTPARARCV